MIMIAQRQDGEEDRMRTGDVDDGKFTVLKYGCWNNV